MANVTLVNAAYQYAARLDHANALIDEDPDEGIRLLQEIVGEPFVPLWMLLAAHLSLAWNLDAESASLHLDLAIRAHAEIEQRWPDMGESSRLNFDVYGRQIGRLRVLIPRLLAEEEAEQAMMEASDALDQASLSDSASEQELSEEDLLAPSFPSSAPTPASLSATSQAFSLASSQSSPPTSPPPPPPSSQVTTAADESQASTSSRADVETPDRRTVGRDSAGLVTPGQESSGRQASAPITLPSRKRVPQS